MPTVAPLKNVIESKLVYEATTSLVRPSFASLTTSNRLFVHVVDYSGHPSHNEDL